MIGLTPSYELPTQTWLALVGRIFFVSIFSIAITLSSAYSYALQLIPSSIAVIAVMTMLHMIFLTHDTLAFIAASIATWLALPASRLVISHTEGNVLYIGYEQAYGVGLVLLPVLTILISRVVKRAKHQWTNLTCFVFAWCLVGTPLLAVAFYPISEISTWLYIYKVIAANFYGISCAAIALTISRSRRSRRFLLARTKNVANESLSVVNTALTLLVLLALAPLAIYESVGVNKFVQLDKRMSILVNENASTFAANTRDAHGQIVHLLKTMSVFNTPTGTLPQDKKLLASLKSYSLKVPTLVRLAIVLPNGDALVRFSDDSDSDLTFDYQELASSGHPYFPKNEASFDYEVAAISDTTMVFRARRGGTTILAISDITKLTTSAFVSDISVRRTGISATTDIEKNARSSSNIIDRFLSHSISPNFALPGFVVLARMGRMDSKSDIQIPGAEFLTVTARLSLISYVDNAAEKSFRTLLVAFISVFLFVLFAKKTATFFLNRLELKFVEIENWFANPSPDKPPLNLGLSDMLEVNKISDLMQKIAKTDLILLAQSHKAERSATQSLDRLEKVIELSSSDFFFTDKRCRLHSFGNSLEELFGWTGADLNREIRIGNLTKGYKATSARLLRGELKDIGNSLVDIVAVADEPSQLVEMNNYKISLEIEYTKDSESKTLRLACTPFSSGHQNPEKDSLMWEVIDNTAYSQQLTELEHANRLTLMGETVTGIAHELNQPLNVIGLASRNIEQRIANGSFDVEFLKKKIHRIDQQVHRAAKLVSSMRSQARIAPERDEEVDLNICLRDLVEIMTPQLTGDDVKLNFVSDENLPIVWANERYITQILTNLIINARDAVLSSNLDGNYTAVNLFARATAKKVFIEVVNSGPDIPSDVIKKVFDPFFTTKSDGKGTGLGLSICQTMAKRLGGDIVVTSQDQLTIFTLSLPKRD